MAYADQWGISLSNTCITMLTNNITTNCPTYDEIMMLFPDTTNRNMVGEFENINGITQRGKPNLKNPIEFYRYSTENILWIDPPGDVRNKIKMIYIEASLPEYKIGANSTKMDDYNISFGKDRYINPNCSESKITAKDWVYLTGDTINVLKHKCDLSVSAFSGIVTMNFAKSYQDISTSFKYIHDKWVKESLIACKVRGC
jgi:hypothetical protein